MGDATGLGVGSVCSIDPGVMPTTATVTLPAVGDYSYNVQCESQKIPPAVF